MASGCAAVWQLGVPVSPPTGRLLGWRVRGPLSESRGLRHIIELLRMLAVLGVRRKVTKEIPHPARTTPMKHKP